jgi:hypothetical protein
MRARIPLQETQGRRASEMKGATTAHRLGATSWMAIPFPQCLGEIKEVRVAIPEGR